MNNKTSFKKQQSILLVGGEGTRLHPLTHKTPKPLLKVGSQTIVEYQFNKLKEANIEEVAFATGYKAEKFKTHFKNGSLYGMKIFYAYEPTLLGTGGAIRNAYNQLPPAHPDTPVVIWNGDIISNIMLSKMLTQFRKNKTDAMIYLTPVDNPSAYGLVEIDEKNNVTKFVEKPKRFTKNTTSLINAGCYIFKRKTLETLFPNNETYSVEKDIFPTMLKNNIAISAYVSDATWFDVGTVEKYLQANKKVAENKINNLTYNTDEYSIMMEKQHTTVAHSSSVISDTATITGSIIEENVKIGDNVTIVNSYIARNTHIDNNTTIVETIIGEGAYVGADNEIPSGAKIGNHVRIDSQALRFTNIK